MNYDHETQVTPCGGIFHHWNRPVRKGQPIPQAEIALPPCDDFALVPERGADVERIQAEAREREETERARTAFHEQHQQILL